MYKYTPAKKILKQLAKVSRDPMSIIKKFALAKELLSNYTDQWTFVEHYEKYSAYYSPHKLTHIPIMSASLPVELFDMEVV